MNIRNCNLSLVFFLLVLTGGCEKSTDDLAGTSTGNPPTTTGSGRVALESLPYDTALLTSRSNLFRSIFQGPYGSASVDVNEFKFCVTKIQLKADDDTYIKSTTGSEEIEAELGLIDLSDPTATVDWGTIDIPVGFSLSTLEIEIHEDAELCGGETASVKFNGNSLTKDLEFKFDFDPVVSVDSGDTLKLAIDTIVDGLLSAETAGKLKDEDVGPYLEGKNGKGHEN